MYRNYLKVAWRHILHNKGLSFINIFGLASGMAFAILIGLWINFQLNFNKSHINKDRIAMVMKHTLFNNEKGTQEATPLPLYFELKSNHPEVKRASRLTWDNRYKVTVGEKSIKSHGRFADPDFLQMLTLHAITGNLNTALNDRNAIVLTESLATSLFGSTDVIGRSIQIDDELLLRVSAVIRDLAENNTVRFDFIGSYELIAQNDPFVRDNGNNWGNNFLMNIVELREGVSMSAFSQKIANLNIEKDKTLKDLTLFLHPMNNWHLRSEFRNWVNTGGKLEYVKLFGWVGVFVLLIACINFMNLATARSEKRAREVGVRKAIGSRRKQLIAQFMTETMLTSFIAFALALLFIPLVMPHLHDLGFQHIHVDWQNAQLLAALLATAVATGLLAGSYPALYLSSFPTVKVLKGIIKSGRGATTFRRALVVTQFAISVGLTISTIIVFQQIDHAKQRTLGYNVNNLINVPANKDIAKNYAALKQDLLNSGYIEAVAKTSNPLTGMYNSWSDFSWTGKDPSAQIALDVIMTEWDYDRAVGLEFVQGRPFSREYATDSNAVILNESALALIGYQEPVGKTLKLNDRTLTIVGVVKDMLVQDPFRPVHPAVILFDAFTPVNFVFLRFKEEAPIEDALAAVQSCFQKHNPGYPFEYNFSSEEFARKFETEQQVGRLAAIFAGLAVLIACLGLFGLAAFMAERRTKEIGIRKVLGASILNLWNLLSREFVALVFIGCAIAVPLTLWLMTDWLQGYQYRITVSWWVFAAAAFGAVVIALITVSTQAIRAAFGKPVNSLRAE